MRRCKHPQAYACDRCRKILNRVELRRDAAGKARKPNRDARIHALQDAWNKEKWVFECHYTKVPLLTDAKDHRNHRYLSLEHQTPGVETDIVVVSLLINRVEDDLTDGEFKRMVDALSASFRTKKFDQSTFPDRPFVSE